MSATNGSLTAAQLHERNRELEARIRRQSETLTEWQTRAALAEKAARDSWNFVKLLRGSGQK